MKTLAIFKSLGPVDLKNVRRDSLLVWLPVIPLIMALAIRVGVPLVAAELRSYLSFDLTLYYPLVMSGFAMLVPPLVGMVIGFLLLDERDERVFTALLVTPMPLGGYLFYRISVPLLIGVPMTLVAYPLAGLVPISLLDLLAVALLGSLTAPLVALILATFAENKVAGLAVLKILNMLLLLPLVAYFLPQGWQLLVGVIPAYWGLKVFWLVVAGQSYWPYLIAGLLVNALALALLLRRFNLVLHR